MSNIQNTLKALEDLKRIIGTDFEQSLAEQTEKVRSLTANETTEKLNQDIKKLEDFHILTNNDPALQNIGNRHGAADLTLATNQGQAGQILRLLEYFRNNPAGPTPALKGEPVVSVDIIRLVARCAAISEKFEAARPQLTAAMLQGVAI